MRISQWSEHILPPTPWPFQDACQGFYPTGIQGRVVEKANSILKKQTLSYGFSILKAHMVPNLVHGFV